MTSTQAEQLQPGQQLIYWDGATATVETNDSVNGEIVCVFDAFPASKSFIKYWDFLRAEVLQVKEAAAVVTPRMSAEDYTYRIYPSAHPRSPLPEPSPAPIEHPLPPI
jgi:hypothetical protein